jgi:hypothetical protein
MRGDTLADLIFDAQIFRERNASGYDVCCRDRQSLRVSNVAASQQRQQADMPTDVPSRAIGKRVGELCFVREINGDLGRSMDGWPSCRLDGRSESWTHCRRDSIHATVACGGKSRRLPIMHECTKNCVLHGLLRIAPSQIKA